MRTFKTISSFEKIKVLSDANRMEILRVLMAAPATLTQLARALQQSPAWVRHHMLALESAGLVRAGEIRKTGKVTEKFYAADAEVLLLQETILPKSKKPVLIFSGSHDLAVEGIAESLSRHVTLMSLSVGSLDGLINLRQGICQIAGTHLLDAGGEYNTPFVRHLFPDREVEIITLANRTQGLMLARGNPMRIKKVADMSRPNTKFVNRNMGSGTRLWLDVELRKLKIPGSKIRGYETMVKTHSEAAKLIARGKADVSIGLQAAARQHDLDFIPLFEERYDFVLPREQEKNLNPLLDYIQTADFRISLNLLTGYNTTHSGEQISV